MSLEKENKAPQGVGRETLRERIEVLEKRLAERVVEVKNLKGANMGLTKANEGLSEAAKHLIHANEGLSEANKSLTDMNEDLEERVRGKEE